MKAKIAPAVKALCKRYGVKGTLSVRNHMTLTLTISSGSLDFFESVNRVGRKRNDDMFREQHDHMQVNTYWCHDHFDGACKDFLVEAVAALRGPDFYDRSDIQTDYFDVSHYIAINIGKWDKPYVLTA
jgi:hypothetical protein